MSRTVIVTAMRNEAPHLLEWIAHHRALGVEDFLVYSNDCTDGTDTILDLLAAAGILHHVRNQVPEGRTPQWSALAQAAGHPLYAEAEWVACIDCDEFLNLRPPLKDFSALIAAADADAIILPWRLFGHNGHAMPPASLTTEAYTRAIPENALYPALSRFFKTLYRRGSFGKPGVHRPKSLVTHAKWVDGSGRALPESFAASQGQIMLWGGPLATDLVQLNHYSVRSAGDFLLKRARGLPNHTDKAIDLTYWVERNFNSVEDTSILSRTEATKAELDRLRGLPGIAAADHGARETARTEINRLLSDPETVQFFGRLLLAAGSAPPPPDTARRLVALYRNALRPE
ncbi:glycosyltransferase family 2 protein [Oceaniglobus roseus]|uniref:glycosyltransferase family 2 protein n=1 Tax=Oceaniglobus roseus TaxID=1737570 RepID=UPI000C7ED820|nr:glycosyltransferase family 2 protein [Kandeliimicrobium roseum]